MLSRITIFCFFASYGVTLLLEISRLFFRAPIRMAVIVVFATAGLFAHTVYLWLRVQDQLPSVTALSNWHDWCLLVAWVLASVYVWLTIVRPQSAVGVFILPLILSLVGAARLLVESPTFSPEQTRTIWGAIHGSVLLAGTIVVMFGFVAGLMYLVQSYRLKHKLPPSEGLRLPSLEWLQKENERALVISSVLLGLGLASGIVLNLVKSETAVSWSDPVVATSGILFAWLLAALCFNYAYKPARRGRKVAYLVVASFLFLVLELGIVLFAQHATSVSSDPAKADVVSGGEQ